MKLYSKELGSVELRRLERGSGQENIELLEVHLVSGPDGCVARFKGELTEQTQNVVWGVEEILLHDARVVLDLSGITSFDSRGLEAALGLMDAVRSFGGTLLISGTNSTPCDPCRVRVDLRRP